MEGDRAILTEPFDLNSLAGKTLGEMDFYADQPVVIEAVEVAAERWPKEVFYIPAFLLLLIVMMVQRQRGGTLAGNPYPKTA